VATQFGIAPQPLQTGCITSFGYANAFYLLESRIDTSLSFLRESWGLLTENRLANSIAQKLRRCQGFWKRLSILGMDMQRSHRNKSKGRYVD